MRTALTILVIVALVLVAIGAVNHAATLDLDFLAITWTGISLFWVTVALAAVVLAAGVAAASLARGSAVAAQRKLERELAGTYERLRAAQAAGERTAVAPAVAAPIATAHDLLLEGPAPAPDVPADVTAVTVIAAVEDAQAQGEDEVGVMDEAAEGDEQGAASEAETILATPADDATSEAEAADETSSQGEDADGTAPEAADVTAATAVTQAASAEVATDETPPLPGQDEQSGAGGDAPSGGTSPA